MNKGWLISLVAFTAVFASGESNAKLQKEGWIFSPVAGLSNPKLNTIYDNLFYAPYLGRSQIVVDLPDDIEGENTYPTEEFLFENNLPRVGIGPEAGVEFRRNFGTQNDFYIGIGAWEISSSASVLTVFPLQGEIDNQVLYQRRANFSYTQYYLGWRHFLLERTRRVNLYLNLSLHEIFDIDYKETHVFDFKSGAPQGFQRINVYQTQATGILMLEFGTGAEVRLTDRFSVSMEGAYTFGVEGGALKDIKNRSDYNDGDRLDVPPKPLDPDPVTGEIGALSQDGNSRTTVKLNLDGWRALVKFNVAF